MASIRSIRPTRALRTIAGGDADLENEDVQTSTRVLYGAKGLLLLFVSALSAAIAGYTWSEVFHSASVGIAVACAWFIVSLTLNMIISWKFDQVSIQGTSRWTALPVAVLLGLVIASVNSQFILMRIYAPEIQAHITAKHRDERAAKEAELVSAVSKFAQRASELREKAEADKRVARATAESGLSALQAEVSQLRQRYDEAEKALTTEVEGKSVTKREGEGPAARRKRQEMEAMKALLTASTARLEQERARLHPQVDVAIRSIEATLATALQDLERQKQANEGHLARDILEFEGTPKDGFLHRSAALTAVAWQQPFWAVLFFSLFAVLESMVVFLKGMSGRTEYHQLRRVKLAQLAEKHGNELAKLEVARRERVRLDQEDDLRHLEEITRFDESKGALKAKLAQRVLKEHREGGASDEEVSIVQRRLLRSIPRN